MRSGLATSRLQDAILSLDSAVIACSGGIDSLLLSTVACRIDAGRFFVAHATSPAVPEEATVRVRFFAEQEGWQLFLVNSGEFSDPLYLANPANRCYYCKSHLYSALRAIAQVSSIERSVTLLSGANMDDLKEYRPGLDAAKAFSVRHPFIEAGIGKEQIRAMARDLKLPFSELPASPCLASRLYTGTPVIAQRLRAIEVGENLVRLRTGIEIVRCRMRGNDIVVEVMLGEQTKIDAGLLDELRSTASSVFPEIGSVSLDSQPYKSGRAFLIEATIDQQCTATYIP
jgi:uncharacterized protein